MKLIPKSDFLMVPNLLIKNGIKKLKQSEFIFLLILLYVSQRMSSDKFYYTDEEIIEIFGISQSSITRARKTLKIKGLINYRSGSSIRRKATEYELLPSDKLKIKYRFRV
jgi:hypothetical protein